MDGWMEATKPSQEQARALSAVDRPTGQSTPFDRACRLALAQLLAASRREQRQVSSITYTHTHTAKGEAPAGGRFCVRFCAHRVVLCVCGGSFLVQAPLPPCFASSRGVGVCRYTRNSDPKAKAAPAAVFPSVGAAAGRRGRSAAAAALPHKPEPTRAETKHKGRNDKRPRAPFVACLLACLLASFFWYYYGFFCCCWFVFTPPLDWKLQLM